MTLDSEIYFLVSAHVSQKTQSVNHRNYFFGLSSYSTRNIGGSEYEIQ